jgi:ribosomal protein S18 acetylase RimI-like enzyme
MLRLQFSLFSLIGLSSAFLSAEKALSSFAADNSISSTPTSLYLVPIRKCGGDFTFLSQSDEYRCCIDRYGKFENKYDLSLIEESDLPDVSRFIVQTFGADAIRISQDLGSFERMLMTPAIELVNGYSGIVAFAEVLAGLRSRLSFRLKSKRIDMSTPNLDGLSRDDQISMAACTSVVLALAKNRSNDSNDWHSDVIASVELRLQPCDAKIPFSLPWIDRIERGMASLIGLGKNNGRDLQPYLSNLCVEDSHRGKGIGRALARCVENIAESWGYSRMYLHVDIDNKAATELYKSEGYRDVGMRWNPFWAGKAADIGYFVKQLNPTVKDDEKLVRRARRKPENSPLMSEQLRKRSCLTWFVT